ncbi:MAG: methionyl-tRNA formyltransferase, partial [Evtepia sp.]
QAATPIDSNETVGELHDRLAEMGAELLVETIEKIQNGTATRTVQNEAQVTFAPRLGKELSPIDWQRTATEIHNQVRGLTPWPAATAEFAQMSCKIFKTSLIDESSEKEAGTILEAGKRGIHMVCGQNTVLRIDELQAPGGKRMRASDFLRGHKLN